MISKTILAGAAAILLAATPSIASSYSFWTIWGGNQKTQLADLLSRGYKMGAAYSEGQDIFVLVQGKKDGYSCRIKSSNNKHDFFYCSLIVPQYNKTVNFPN